MSAQYAPYARCTTAMLHGLAALKSHTPLAHPSSATQHWLAAQPGQLPPQSTETSSPLRTPSLHDEAAKQVPVKLMPYEA